MYIAYEKYSSKLNSGEFKIDQKILCKLNQEILKALKNNHSSWKAVQLMYT